MSDEPKRGEDPPPAVTVPKPLAIAVTCGALALAAAHIFWPALTVDGIVLALIVLAAMPWLLPLIEAIELPGGTKVQMRKLEERLRDGFERQERRQERVIERVGELESLLKFSGEPLADTAKARITREVRDFLAYIRACGADSDEDPAVEVVRQTDFGDSVHYEPERDTLVITGRMTEVRDMILRECCFRAFHEPLPAGQRQGVSGLSDSGEGFELGSLIAALGFYYVCSYKNDARFDSGPGARPMELGDPGIPVWNEFLGLRDKADKQEAERLYYVTAVGEAWARWFWMARGRIGGERCDRLLLRAWQEAVSASPGTAARESFGARVLRELEDLDPALAQEARQAAESQDLTKL